MTTTEIEALDAIPAQLDLFAIKAEGCFVVDCRSAAFKDAEAEGMGVYIGRKTRRRPASKWGNPFPLQRNATPEERAEAIAKYEAHLRSTPDLIAALPELRGKVLGCWCAPEACHGDVLARLVDQIGAVECRRCGEALIPSSSSLPVCLDCQREAR